MELILLESVDGLGRPGDQVKVKAGYARNYLLPSGKALPLCADSLRGIDKLKAKADAEEQQMISSMEEMAQKLAGVQVEISARATAEGHLFGSVTDKDVHAAFVTAGWELPPRAVRLPAHLKEAGPAEVTLHLHGEITVDVTVVVIPVDVEGIRIALEVEDGVMEESEADADADADGQPGDAGGAADDAPEQLA
jgi:large subunit ribosomal protein L9